MPNFDFIADDTFRHNLEADDDELARCIKAKSWKAVVVLAGSVVEVILVDALVARGFRTKSGGDALSMSLADVIETYQREEIISDKAAHLSSVIRSYRNLIHPGISFAFGRGIRQAKLDLEEIQQDRKQKKEQ